MTKRSRYFRPTKRKPHIVRSIYSDKWVVISPPWPWSMSESHAISDAFTAVAMMNYEKGVDTTTVEIRNERK